MKLSKPILLLLTLVLLMGVALFLMKNRLAKSQDAPTKHPTSQQNKPDGQSSQFPETAPDSASPNQNTKKPVAANLGSFDALPPSKATGRIFPVVDINQLAAGLPRDQFAVFERVRLEFPEIDWTEIDSTHQAFLDKRAKLPLNLSDEQRETYAAWLAEVETMSRALIKLRAEAYGLSAGGMEGDQGYYIDGFRNGEPVYVITGNVGAATTTGVSFVRWNPGFDPALGDTINGGELYVSVLDHGEIYEHSEFQLPDAGGSRIMVKQIPSYTGGNRNHMTHVAGTIAAWGYNPSLQGMAPRSWIRSLIQQSSSNVTSYAMATPGQQMTINNPRTGARQLRSVVGNTSLGTTNPYNRYNSTAANYDNILRDYAYYVHFNSTGNSGSKGYESITGDWKIAKNMFNVGNVTNVTRDTNGAYVSGGLIQSSSSTGPTYDGRICPDFVGKGTLVLSTTGTTGSSTYSGTSMASPNVTGSVALLMDYVRQRLPQQYLRSSTYRALLSTTADDRGNPGPDYTYGWGILNIHAAAKIVRQQAGNSSQRLILEESLAANQTWTQTYVSNGTDPIRVSMAWLDPASTNTDTNSRASRIVNDLDIRIIGPGSTEHSPFVMPFTTGQGGTPAFDASLYNVHAVRGDNNTDVVEQVFIATPAPGSYTVSVTHKGNLRDNLAQPFSIAVSGLINVPPSMDVARSGPSIGVNGIDGVPGTTAGAVTQLTYTITNSGDVNLDLTAPVTISGLSNCTVAVNTQPAAIVPGGQSTHLVLTVTPSVPGTWSFGASITNNDPAKNPYLWTATGVAGNGSVANAPLMAVIGTNGYVPPGATIPISSSVAGVAIPLSYTIANLGNEGLAVTTPITVTPVNNCFISGVSQPGSLVAASASTVAGLSITPTAGGSWSATVSIANNDADKNPYTWTISGSALGRYHVIYHGNNSSSGTPPVDPNNPYLESASVTVLGNTGNLAKSGSVFAGWNTAANGLGTTYAPGATFSMPDSDVTLFAIWNATPIVNAGPDQILTLASGEWTPLELSPGLWLDASDDNRLLLNDSAVSQWNDKSGFNRHAIAPEFNQPDATANQLNGKRVVTFNGIDDFLNVDLDFLAGVSHTAFIVTKPTIFSKIYGAANGSQGANSLHVGFDGDNYRMNLWGNDFGPARSANYVASSANIVNYVWNTGVSKQIFANGKSEGSNTDAGVIGTMAGGGRIGQITDQETFGGDIAEIIIIPSVLDLEDRQKVEGYLAHKWGLTANLAVSHPYKTAPPSGNSVTATLAGSANDSDGDAFTKSWTRQSGPFIVDIQQPTVLNTATTFIREGVYTLRLTATDTFSSASDDVTITVNPAVPIPSVTYLGNGNTDGISPVDSQSPYAPGSTVTVLGADTLARTGYTFAGWNTAANGSGTSYAPSDTFSITGPVILRAQWTPNTYTVTFDANNGTSPVPATKQVTYDAPYGTLATTTRTGFTFNGWFTAPSGGTQVTEATPVAIAGNHVYYAHWSLTPVSVVTNASAVAVPEGSAATFQVKLSAQPVATTNVTVTRTAGDSDISVQSGASLTFTTANWDTFQTVTLAADHDPDVENGTATITCESSDSAHSSAILAASEIDNETTLTVASGGNGTTTPSGSVIVEKSATTVITATPADGHDFVNWTVQSGSATLANASAASTTASITAPTTVQANFIPSTFTITFDANGGGTPTPASKQVTFGSTYGTLATVSRDGHFFNGWFTAAEGGTQVTAATLVTATANHTLHAQWSLGVFLSWDANGTTANQTNGAGAWLNNNLWWDGSANTNWVPGSRASFGGPSTAGGAVTLASPTSVYDLEFNTFTGTYTLGSSGQAISLAAGINKTSTSAAVTLASPITLEGNQTWTNNSSGLLLTGNGTNLITNAGFKLTVEGSGPITLGALNNTAVTLSGTGALIKNGPGVLSVGGDNSAVFSGNVRLNGGILFYGDYAGSLGTGNIEIADGVLEARWTGGITRTQGSGANQIRITGGESGFSGSGSTSVTFDIGAITWGSSTFNPTKLLLQTSRSQQSTNMTLSSAIDLNGATRTFVVNGGTNGAARAIVSGTISNSTGTGSLIKEGAGMLNITNSSSIWNGTTTVSGGILDFGTMSSSRIGGGGRTVTIAAGSGVRVSILSKSYLNRIVETTAEIGVMTGRTINALDFSSSTGANLPNAFLGNWSSDGAKAEIIGTITPASDAYRLGAKGSSGLLGIVGTNKLTGNRGLIIGMTGASGIRVEIAADNDFTGDTVINSGTKLTLGNNLALRNSTLNLGSVGGTFALSTGAHSDEITGSSPSPNPTLGGLSGSRNLIDAFSTTAGNNEQLLAATAVVGLTLNLTDGKSCTYSGAIGGFGSGASGSTGGAMTFTKSGLGTQILAGTNTYTGTTAVNAGKLLIDGNQSAATGNVNVAASAILGGTGTIGGNTTIANNGQLEFNLNTLASSHDKLELASGKSLTFSGNSVLTITSTGGAAPGSYVLLTAPGGITGSAPATLNLPAGWLATVSIIGNDLVLNLSAIPGTAATFVISGIPVQATAGTAINGVTLTAKDPLDNIATSFTGTVTFGGTAGVTGTSANFVAGILTDVSITPTTAGAGLTFTVHDGASHTGTATLDVLTALTLYQTWADANRLTAAAMTDNPDGDAFTNLQEFAFGMDPTNAATRELVFAIGGQVTQTGPPQVRNLAAQEAPADFRAVFTRRKEHIAAGLTYTVEFSADLIRWESSATPPTVLTAQYGSENIEAASVPFPNTVPSAGTGGDQKPKFFRVSVSGM